MVTKETRKPKLQGSAASACKTLQSKIGQSPENRLTLNRLVVFHARLYSQPCTLNLSQLEQTIDADKSSSVM
jgi:hypothetical protein